MIGESRLVQRLIEKIARAVACEYSARAIRPMRRGSQPKNEQLRAGIAEAGNSASPIRPLAKRAPLLFRHPFPVFHQPGTFAARANFFRDDFQRGVRVQRFLFNTSASTTA